MMAELCLHIIDLMENSARAGARAIEVSLLRSKAKDLLELEIHDDGCGMDEETVRRVQDPFYTTKSGKKVGLGVPLLKAAAEMTGGRFSLDSEPGRGTRVRAAFILSHIDTPPIGALADTVLTQLVAHEEIDIRFRLRSDNGEFSLSTAEIREQVGDMPLSHPEILAFLRPFIRQGVDETF